MAGLIINPFAFGGGGGATDPDFASVVLLCHADGSNGSTSFTDSSSYARTLTSFGSVGVTTTSPKFGSGAADNFFYPIGGLNGSVSAAAATSLDFGTGDLTVEGWFNFASLNTFRCLFYRANVGANDWLIASDFTDSSKLIFLGGNSGQITSATGLLTTGAYHHIAWTRESGTSKLWFDGVQVGSSMSDTFNYTHATNILYIGSNAGAQAFDGKWDDVRITNGVARYTGTFTPPTAAFPNS